MVQVVEEGGSWLGEQGSKRPTHHVSPHSHPTVAATASAVGLKIWHCTHNREKRLLFLVETNICLLRCLFR